MWPDARRIYPRNTQNHPALRALSLQPFTEIKHCREEKGCEEKGGPEKEVG